MKYGDFFQANKIEQVHLEFCKSTNGCKKTTQNKFVYGEVALVNYATIISYSFKKYCFKILTTPDNKYVKII